ncbi:phosphatidylinositol-specific phospholipase C domain-containing protein [Streptomyces sp. TRM43335]|uniref:1-phosphatidylinositol phosphodiesterase n=1 Tax=Streptomyces taklimakanensis TaxID=2569853 RepID=A0A6G2BJF2_9ACTN|nr:phosphatidylinositol-specific phospholipase C [Streptomyces taklimakanensis]MTE22344.1 phosphatidylinositol-specific phospholipase C domain-containing protein [Streptomyces taklimakanensis]
MRRLPALLAPLLTAVAVTVCGPGDTARAYSDPESYRSLEANAHPAWMAAVRGDASLAELSVPGTHDTLAVYGGAPTETQERHERGDGRGGGSLAHQLRAGIRAIDIRVRIVSDDRGRARFAIHHGAVYQRANFDDVVRELDTFLREHPTETVLLHLHAECAGGLTGCTDADPCPECGTDHNHRRRQIFDAYVDANRELFWQPSVTGAAHVPTLDEVRGKVVLVNWSGPHGGNYTDYGLQQLNYADWPDEWGPQKNCYVQNSYRVDGISLIDDKWEKVHAQLDRTNRAADCRDPGRPNHDRMYVNWTSGASFWAYPYTVAGGTPTATGVNGFLHQCLTGRNNRCDTPSVRRTGVLMMDFPGHGLVDEIIRRNPTG